MAKINEDVPTNAMGNSSSSNGPIQTFHPLLMRKPLRRNELLKQIKTKFGKK